MNVDSIVRGYDEKFISELKDKLKTHIQRSVQMDPWCKYGGDSLYSQSLIDIYLLLQINLSTGYQNWILLMKPW